MDNILDNFCIFILSHENPYKNKTWKTLKESKIPYTGKVFIVLDDEDKCIEEYKRIYGEDNVVLYNKDEQEAKTDMMDQEGKRGITVYVRNACFDLAKKLGYRYFMELDEDYSYFVFRYEQDGKLLTRPNYHFEETITEVLDYYIKHPEIKSLCLGQNGDLIGGKDNCRFKARMIRKAMNSFICDIERPFKFMGRMNDDVNAYCALGARGDLFLTIYDCVVDADTTQSHKGGMSEIYLDNGTYRKSFYSVMCCPSFVKISMMGETNFRIHHNIKWNNAVPKILSSRYRK